MSGSSKTWQDSANRHSTEYYGGADRYSAGRYSDARNYDNTRRQGNAVRGSSNAPRHASVSQQVSAPRIPVVARYVVLAVVGLVIGLGVYRFDAVVLAGDALPMPFGFGVATVMSGSMSPALEVDDLVVVQAQENYQVGDIIVYQSERNLVTHRLIAWEDGLIIAKGDANNVADEPIAESAVKGTVVLRVPFVGAAANALRTPAVLIAVLLGVFVLLGLSFRAERRTRDAELDDLRGEVSRLREELAVEYERDSRRRR